MRATLTMCTVAVGLGLAVAGDATAANLSCISEISPNEQRLLRDCELKPEEVQYAIEVLNQLPPPPITIKNGEGGKGGGVHGDRGHDAPAGGRDASGPHGAAN